MNRLLTAEALDEAAVLLSELERRARTAPRFEASIDLDERRRLHLSAPSEVGPITYTRILEVEPPSSVSPGHYHDADLTSFEALALLAYRAGGDY